VVGIVKKAFYQGRGIASNRTDKKKEISRFDVCRKSSSQTLLEFTIKNTFIEEEWFAP